MKRYSMGFFHGAPAMFEQPDGGYVKIEDVQNLLAEFLVCCSPHDPHRNKSNAGRWVTINAPRELVERARAFGAEGKRTYFVAAGVGVRQTEQENTHGNG